jgi:hypothetical protein
MMTATQFVVQMAVHVGVGGNMQARDALPLASGAYREFLADEKIEFGAHGYDWTKSGARTLAEDYVLANL